jgi:hypothetical protein
MLCAYILDVRKSMLNMMIKSNAKIISNPLNKFKFWQDFTSKN